MPQRDRARIRGRTSRQHIIDEHNRSISKISAPPAQPPRDSRSERACEIPTAILRRQAGLRRTSAPARERTPDGRAKMAREVVGLIESTPKCAHRMQRHWHHRVRID